MTNARDRSLITSQGGVGGFDGGMLFNISNFGWVKFYATLKMQGVKFLKRKY